MQPNLDTPKEQWSPSSKQAKLLEAAITPDVGRTITAICEEAGVSRVSFWRWYKKDKDFREAWNGIWREAIDRHMPSVVAWQVKKATDGDTQAARLISDLSGKMIKQVDVTSGGEKLNIVGIEVVPAEKGEEE